MGCRDTQTIAKCDNCLRVPTPHTPNPKRKESQMQMNETYEPQIKDLLCALQNDPATAEKRLLDIIEDIKQQLVDEQNEPLNDKIEELEDELEDAKSTIETYKQLLEDIGFTLDMADSEVESLDPDLRPSDYMDIIAHFDEIRKQIKRCNDIL